MASGVASGLGLGSVIAIAALPYKGVSAVAAAIVSTPVIRRGRP